VGAERFLITGALGCIGAWATRQLVREGVDVVTFDLGQDRRRLEAIMTSGELAHVPHVVGDVTEFAGLERALDEHETTHVVHLAAMLIPLAKADPPRGAHVNVVGTVNVFEAVKRRRERIVGLAYASSAAAFDKADGRRVAETADGHPVTHYGVHKLANEGTARVYWLDDGIPSAGLRPYIVYGPGRDTGLTAAPTLAIEAAVRGEPYHIGFGGLAQYQYAPDAAAAFVSAARAAHEGAVTANLGGPPTHMRDVVAAVESAVPGAAGTITFDEVQLPFPEDFEAAAHPAPVTPLETGVRETAEHFRNRA
jgi:nucleoside-diphosphate-sugar epimerase